LLKHFYFIVCSCLLVQAIKWLIYWRGFNDVGGNFCQVINPVNIRVCQGFFRDTAQLIVS